MLLLALLVVAADPAPAAAPAVAEHPKLIVLDLEARDVPKETADTLTSAVVAAAASAGTYEVFASADVRRMIDLEVARSLSGCDATSCMSEIANAMGANLVLYGEVGVLEGRTVLTVSLLDTGKGKPLGRTVVENPGSASVRAAVRALLGASAEGPGAGLFVAAGGGAVAVIGAVVAVVGLLPLASYRGELATLATLEQQDAPADDDVARAGLAAEEQRAAWNSWGIALAYTGAAAAVVGAGTLATGIVLGATE